MKTQHRTLTPLRLVLSLTILAAASCGDSGGSGVPGTIDDQNNEKLPGQAGHACYLNNTCNAGLECSVDQVCIDPNAAEGQLGGPCDSSGNCDGGLECSAATVCVEPAAGGGLGQACGPSNPCNQSLLCVSGICTNSEPAARNMTSERVDVACDGLHPGVSGGMGRDECFAYTYDEAGNRTSFQLDMYCDGEAVDLSVFPGDQCFKYTYDNAGNLTSIKGNWAWGWDFDRQQVERDDSCNVGENLYSYCSTIEYDGNTTIIRTGSLCDGAVDSVAYYEYNDVSDTSCPLHEIGAFVGSGRRCDEEIPYGSEPIHFAPLTSLRVDSDNDGTVDLCHTWAYDDAGYLTSEQYDLGCDGTLERCNSYVYEYDAAGNPTKIEEDNDCDGTVDTSTRYEYNDAGNITRLSYANSEYENCSIVLYEYDDDGNVTKQEFGDCDGTGFDGNGSTFEYDDAGNVTSKQTSSACYTYEYD